MKHTPVQWLEIVLIWDPISEEEFEHNMNCWKQAKEMEKEQMVDWYATGQADTVNMYEQHLNKTSNTNEK